MVLKYCFKAANEFVVVEWGISPTPKLPSGIEKKNTEGL